MDKTPIQLFTTQQQQLLLLLKAIEQQTLLRQADHNTLIDQLQANQTSITATLDAVSDNAAASQSAFTRLVEKGIVLKRQAAKKKTAIHKLEQKAEQLKEAIRNTRRLMIQIQHVHTEMHSGQCIQLQLKVRQLQAKNAALITAYQCLY